MTGHARIGCAAHESRTALTRHSLLQGRWCVPAVSPPRSGAGPPSPCDRAQHDIDLIDRRPPERRSSPAPQGRYRFPAPARPSEPPRPPDPPALQSEPRSSRAGFRPAATASEPPTSAMISNSPGSRPMMSRAERPRSNRSHPVWSALRVDARPVSSVSALAIPERARTIALPDPHPARSRRVRAQASGGRSAGIRRKIASRRSITPPCPGMRRLESFTSKWRLRADFGQISQLSHHRSDIRKARSGPTGRMGGCCPPQARHEPQQEARQHPRQQAPRRIPTRFLFGLRRGHSLGRRVRVRLN